MLSHKTTSKMEYTMMNLKIAGRIMKQLSPIVLSFQKSTCKSEMLQTLNL